MPNTNRRTVMRTAIATLAGALPTASLAGRPTPEAKPFTIPPPPAPPGASQELLNAIDHEYSYVLSQFGCDLDTAQAMFSKYPDLVTSKDFPQECIAPMASVQDAERGCSEVVDTFMRPEEILEEAEDLVQSIRADAEARAERRAEEEEKRKAAEAQAEHERRERINSLTPAQRAEEKVQMLAWIRKSVDLLVKTYDEDAVELRETHGIVVPTCITLPR